MIRRLKYWLFCWLMCEICEKSNCRTCNFDVKSDGNVFGTCKMSMACEQARKVWKIGGNENE